MNLDINITVQPEDDPELLEIVLCSVRAFLSQLKTQVDTLNIELQPMSITWPLSIDDIVPTSSSSHQEQKT